MTELESFMREKHYNRVVRLYGAIENHLWSKQITASDSAMVADIRKELMEISNSLYALREEMKNESQK